MAITTGKPFSWSDLDALAKLANSKGVSNAVWPMFNDLAGAPYGYRRLTNIELVNVGSGYSLNEILNFVVTGHESDPGVQLKVISVGPAGELLGLEIIENPGFAPSGDNSSFPTYGDPVSPKTLNYVATGSGTGAQISFGIEHIGPYLEYNFPDIPAPGKVNVGTREPTQSRINSLWLDNGGAGYAVNNVLTIPGTFNDLTNPIQVRVTAVDGSGKITAFDYLSTGFQNVYFVGPPSPIDATGGAGSGAIFRPVFVMEQRPMWLAELIRLKSHLQEVDWSIVPTPEQYVSLSAPGIGWPKTGYVTGASGYDPKSAYQEFYFADTGTSESITLSALTGIPHVLLGWVLQDFTPYNAFEFSSIRPPEYPASPFPGPQNGRTIIPFVVGATYKIRIKCPPGTTFSGTIKIPYFSYAYTCNEFWDRGTVTTVSSPSFVVTTNLPGSFAPVADGYGLGGNLVGTFSGVETGDYTIQVSGGSIDATVTEWYTNPAGERLPNKWSGVIAVLEYQSVSATTVVPISAVGSFEPPTVWGAVKTNGIHNTKDVYKIVMPSGVTTDNPHGYGVTAIYRLPYFDGALNLGEANAYSAVKYNGPDLYPLLSFSHSFPGFWVGSTRMLESLPLANFSQMPWNKLITKIGTASSITCNPALLGDKAGALGGVARVSNTYDNQQPVESQMEPPSWQASTVFTLGFYILDSNGNIQTVTTAGTSGAGSPAWETREGLTTGDGSVVWTCKQITATPSIGWSPASLKSIGDSLLDPNGNVQLCIKNGHTGGFQPIWNRRGITNDGGTAWRVANPIKSAKHRLAGTPRYPFYWYDEPLAWMRPPTPTSGLTRWGANNQWQRNPLIYPDYDQGWQQDNFAFGWWIYRVALNRLHNVVKQPPAKSSGIVGAGDTTVGAGDDGTGGIGAGASTLPAAIGDGEVQVTIGCMRNGVFVSFGTFATGQVIRVLWPIFTSDALVYKCVERVDLQAVALTGPVGSGWGVSTPICENYITDTIKLLNFL